MDRFAFLCGLPRAGSTILTALLSQHPSLHTTKTSQILGLVNHIKKLRLGESPYFDVKDPDSPVWNMMRGMFYGAYEHIESEIVIEKNRGWAGDINLLRALTNSEPCIIAPVRPIPEIIASFILLSQKIGATSKIEKELKQNNQESNVWTLSRLIWEKYIYGDWRKFKIGYEQSPESFLLIDYDAIVTQPKQIMSLICTYLDVAPWAPSTDNLINPNPENDAIYGLPGLHAVRSELKRTSPPAEEVLGLDCYSFWTEQQLEFWQNG